MWKIFNKRQSYYIASIIFLVLAIIYFIQSLQRPYIGLDLKASNGQWIVVASDTYGEGYRSGIRIGDQILTINGNEPGNYFFVKKWGMTENAETIEYKKQGQTLIYTVSFTEQPLSLALLRVAPMFILGFVFWLLGFITWLKRPFLEQAQRIFWMNWSFGLAIFLAHPSGRCIFLAKELEFITLSIASVLLISFIMVFPVHNSDYFNKYARRIVIGLFITVVVLLLAHSSGIYQFLNLIKKLSLTTMLIAIFVTLWNLLRLIIKISKDKPERNEAQIFLLGIILGFSPIVFFTALPQIFNLEQRVYTQVSALFISAIPISLYYLIVNKYLPDSRRLYTSIVSYFVLSIVFSFFASYFLVLLDIVPKLNLDIFLALFFAVIVFLFCFKAARILMNNSHLIKYLERVFKHRFRQLKHDLRVLFSEDNLLEETVQKLGIEGALVIIENPQIGYLIRAVGRYRENNRERAQLEDYYHQHRRGNLEAKVLPEDYPAEIFVPFSSQDSSCGIFFGHRYSRIKYESGELSFLTLLAGQLAYQMIMSQIITRLTKEINALNKSSSSSQRRSKELQELNSFLIKKLEQKTIYTAEEILRAPLQIGLDLSRFFKCLDIEQEAESGRQSMTEQMREMTKDLNFELIRIVYELCPPELKDLGLLEAVKSFSQKIMRKELAFITIETSHLESNNRFAEDVELTAYRLVEEGVKRSLQQPGTKKLTIRLELEGGRLKVTITDPRQSLEPERTGQKLFDSSSCTLMEMKERIESLGGELRNELIGDQGIRLQAVIPV